MAAILFTDFDDLKPFVGNGYTNNNIATVESFVADAARDFVEPFVGRDFLATLNTAFQAGTMSAPQAALLPYLQRPLAHFAYYLMAQEGGMEISDSGFTVPDGDQVKQPYQYQLRDFRKTKLANGWAAMEAAILYLYANKASFATWWSGAERLELWALLVWKTKDFDKYRKLGGFGTVQRLKPYILNAQAGVVKPNIGATLYDLVMSELLADNLSADNTALLPYMKKVAGLAAISKAALELPWRIGADGIYVEEVDGVSNNSDKLRAASADDCRRIYGFVKDDLDGALAELRAFLNTEASATKYVSYFDNEDLYDDPSDDDEDFKSRDAGLSDGETFIF